MRLGMRLSRHDGTVRKLSHAAFPLVRTGGQGRDRTADLPLFREQCNHALTRQDAAQWTDLGTYRA